MSSAKPEGLKDDGSPYRVLVVDDSVFAVKQLTQILASEGFEVIDSAVDGGDAVEKYQKLHPKVDLVTLDVTMPGMDGLSCLEKIMQFDKDAKVVMVSALGKQDLVKRSFLVGAKSFIVKPLDREKVLERLRAVLHP